MIGIRDAFSTSYAKARVKFLEAAVLAGLQIESHNHPEDGAEDETLAMDVARAGALDADRLLIVSSACHGIEGYCGSGVQVHALHDEEWQQKARDAGVAVLYVHALNPHGFSYGRRVTHENVDLNRNFIDFNQPLPTNPAYDEVQDLILPAQWPPTPDVQQAIDRYIAERGQRAWQGAVGQGQYQHPTGVFFGGQAPTWSNRTIRQVLRQHGGKVRRLAWIDIHTGLGPNGYGERIFTGPNDAQMLARARRCGMAAAPRPLPRWTMAAPPRRLSRACCGTARCRNARRPSSPALRWNTAPCRCWRPRAPSAPITGYTTILMPRLHSALPFTSKCAQRSTTRAMPGWGRS